LAVFRLTTNSYLVGVKKEIAGHLALLVGSFPNAGSADRTIYGRMLCEEIAADQASISDLEAACRQIRRTSTFLPTIAEVLKAIGEAKNQRRTATNEMTGMFKYREDLLDRIEKERLVAKMRETARELIQANADAPMAEMQKRFPDCAYFEIRWAIDYEYEQEEKRRYLANPNETIF
jgi:hypothetical protein